MADLPSPERRRKLLKALEAVERRGNKDLITALKAALSGKKLDFSKIAPDINFSDLQESNRP